MGNQQERQVAEARLAMFFETEGYFTIRAIKRGKDRPYDLKPIVGVTNTSKDLIEWAASTLDEMNVGRYVQWVKPHGLGKLPQGRVLVEGLKRVETFLPILRPWMLVKTRQADLIKEFIDSRVDNMGDYTQHEIDIANEVRQMAAKGPKAALLESSETLCRNPKWTKAAKDKIKSDL